MHFLLIFLYPTDCFEDISSRLGYTITSSTLKSGTVRNAYINSKNSWCANVNDQSQFIKISFGNAMKVSGIAIQGNAQGSDWVKTFKVKYKAPCGVETEITTVSLYLIFVNVKSACSCYLISMFSFYLRLICSCVRSRHTPDYFKELMLSGMSVFKLRY